MFNSFVNTIYLENSFEKVTDIVAFWIKKHNDLILYIFNKYWYFTIDQVINLNEGNTSESIYSYFWILSWRFILLALRRALSSFYSNTEDDMMEFPFISTSTSSPLAYWSMLEANSLILYSFYLNISSFFTFWKDYSSVVASMSQY